MARMTKEQKRVEKQVDDLFKKHSYGIQFNISDLGKISDAGVKAAEQGQNVEEAVKAAIQQYRMN